MNRKNLNFVYNYVKQYKWIWLLGVILTAISMIVKIRYSWLMKDLIDDALIPKNYSLLLKLCIVFPLLVLTCSFLNYLKEYCFNFVSQKSIVKMRQDLFSHILKLPYKFFVKNENGEIINRLINDVENTQEAFSDYIVSLISSIITIIFVLTWLFFIHFKLAILMLIIVPIFIVVTNILWKKIETISSKVASQRGEVTSYLQQILQSSELVKLIGDNNFFVNKLIQLCKKWSNNIVKLRMHYIFANSLWESILTPYQGVIYLVGGIWYINSGSPSIGTIMAFMNYINLLIPATLTLINDITSMARGVASLDRLQEYLAEKPEESGTKLLSKEKEVTIEFKNVSYHHETSDFALDNLNLLINNKDFIVVVGSTGSGKSTLMKLLVRLYDVDSGEILINGINIKEYDINDLRQSFGFVQQDVYLLKGSIKDNLISYNSNITEEQLQQVIKIAQLDEFINNLPQKLNTMIEEQGLTLSGGEKQRISIARMLLRNNKVIVMDEPTSALDLKTESYILQNMKSIYDSVTTIAIDHRLATLNLATKIIVMSNGRIVEYGTYNELIEYKGEFCNLLNIKNG